MNDRPRAAMDMGCNNLYFVCCTLSRKRGSFAIYSGYGGSIFS